MTWFMIASKLLDILEINYDFQKMSKSLIRIIQILTLECKLHIQVLSFCL